MKKLFSLALSAVLAASMMANAFAADHEYAYFNDFEADSVGAYNSDGVIALFPKQGEITVANFDGTNCLKFNHIANETSYDSFADLFPASSMSVAGIGSAYVLEYDVYFETIADDMGAYALMSRETPASGTVFLNAGGFSGAEKSVVVNNENVATIETGKWYTLAIAVDVGNDNYSVYLDGYALATNVAYPDGADTSATSSERVRIGFQGHKGDSVMYIDNIKAYNGTTPYEVKTAAPTTDATTSTTTSSAATADIAVVLAAISAVAASGIIVSKKRK